MEGSPGRPSAIPIIGLIVVTPGPLIHQGVAGAGIKTTDGPRSMQRGDIGDAPQVHHNAVFIRRRKHAPVKRRCQGCALAAQFQIGLPELTDHGDSRQPRQFAGVAQLERPVLFFVVSSP